MNDHPTIQNLFVGQPQTITDSQGIWQSSIYRRPVETPVALTITGLRGDKVTQAYHGGADAALCVHLQDHYQFWNSKYGMQLASGFVGENLTLAHIIEDDVCVGDIVKIGSALVQVSEPRIPCANLARRIGRSDWVRLTIQENRTGFYMRVLEPGTVQVGDAWELQERLNKDGTIPAINHCFYLEFDFAFARRVTQMEGLVDWWKKQFIEKAEKMDTHWSAEMG